MLSSLSIPFCLQPGDTIATISLSWGGAGDPAFSKLYQTGKRCLEETFGVKVREMTNTLKGSEYLKKHVQAKVDDLHEAFGDPGIKAIVSCIGGEDSIHMIDKIDYDLLRKNPKIFTGYSDSTVQHFVNLKAGIRSYYGPGIMTQFAEPSGLHPYLQRSILQTLFSGQRIGALSHSPEGWRYENLDGILRPGNPGNRDLYPPLPWTFIQGNAPVQGRLIGGCADVLPLIHGTPVWPDKETWQGAILFLENFGDPNAPDILEKCLQVLGEQGLFGQIRGLLYGRPDGRPADEFHQFDGILLRAAAAYGRPDLPIITRMDFGHSDPQMILPYSALATIDPVNKTFSIDEPGCRQGVGERTVIVSNTDSKN